MAALNTLWTGLALLGMLAVLQIPTQAQAALQPNFQEDKEAGGWGGAGKAARQRVGHPGPPPAPAHRGRPSPRVPDQPGLSPGLPDWSGNHEVSVVETDYEAYALLYTESFRGPGQDFCMATLYSRTQAPKAEIKEKFATFAKAQGFTEDGIVFLPQTDKCMEEHT
eukprot:bmy_14829T0